jgi:hypothetical protein
MRKFVLIKICLFICCFLSKDFGIIYLDSQNQNFLLIKIVSNLNVKLYTSPIYSIKSGTLFLHTILIELYLSCSLFLDQTLLFLSTTLYHSTLSSNQFMVAMKIATITILTFQVFQSDLFKAQLFVLIGNLIFLMDFICRNLQQQHFWKFEANCTLPDKQKKIR